VAALSRQSNSPRDESAGVEGDLKMCISPALVITTASVNVNLYSDPDDTSKVLRKIPLGDLVLYPQEDLAPTQAEGWVWVRHDLHQEAIWQSGIYGWVLVENISDCG